MVSEQEALEVLDGLLLGDGSIQRYTDGAVYSMIQSKSTISIEDHLRWEYWLRDNIFSTLNVRAVVKLDEKLHRNGPSKGQKYLCASMWTGRSILLARAYDEWYKGGEWAVSQRRVGDKSQYYIRSKTKIIPERIMSSSVLPISSITHWFLGDGESSWHHLERHTPSVEAGFSTCVFSRKEVLHLKYILNNMGIRTTLLSSRGTIKIAQDSINYFMSLIEPHIIEIFDDSTGLSYKDLIKYRSPVKRVCRIHKEIEEQSR